MTAGVTASGSGAVPARPEAEMTGNCNQAAFKPHEAQLAKALGQENLYTESNNSKIFLQLRPALQEADLHSKSSTLI